jgi:predicted Zn-dependent protease
MTKNTSFYKTLLLTITLGGLAACSTNVATGEKQFTPFMPASSEAQIGAQEHTKILAQYGGPIENTSLSNYVTNIGQKLVPHTERNDVKYTFTVIDSPIVNAFALPGGYVYISRGILTMANNEAELAAVIGHEIGHVTARHSAERYSRGVLASIGASVISATIKTPGVDQAVGLGANLYLSSYSRAQESQSDDLGIRYIARAGYDPMAMSDFHRGLKASTALDAKIAGRDGEGEQFNYFSTHPITSQRITDSSAEARKYPANNTVNRENYLRAIDGMIYGDSPKQGFIVGKTFIHPVLGFKFNVPSNFSTENNPDQFIAASKRKNGPIAVFTGAKKQPNQTITQFLTNTVLGGNLSKAVDLNTTTINGMPAATVEVPGTIAGAKANIRMVAVQWDSSSVYLFKLVMPMDTTSAEMQELKNMAFSLNRISPNDKARYQPKRIDIFTAVTGDTVARRASKMPFDDGLNIDRFRVINGLVSGQELQSGMKYKTISQ